MGDLWKAFIGRLGQYAECTMSHDATVSLRCYGEHFPISIKF